jgi:site-specific DNA-methyltransferase (adenine-specific)
MKEIPDGTVDLVVTSPPYDGLRDYNGVSFDLHATGEQIFRVLKEGGIAVMVIQDQTKNFGKSLTSFRTIIDWCDSFNFKLFECLIYRKNGTEGAWWKQRFRVDHEYMPVFLKGDKPQYFNKESIKIPSKHGGKTMTGFANRKTNGKTQESVTKKINLLKCPGTIWTESSKNEIDLEPLGSVWDYLMAGDKNPIKRMHPAPFPDKIPYDFINVFCPPNGIVLDPFMGSGSTAVSAKKLGRRFIGFDTSKEYCEIAEKRLIETEIEFPLFHKII